MCVCVCACVRACVRVRAWSVFAVQLAPGSRTLKFQLQRARAVNRLMKHNLQVFRTHDGRGWGVSAVQAIPAGAFVCSYVGELLTSAEADQRSDSLYPLRLIITGATASSSEQS